MTNAFSHPGNAFAAPAAQPAQAPAAGFGGQGGFGAPAQAPAPAPQQGGFGGFAAPPNQYAAPAQAPQQGGFGGFAAPPNQYAAPAQAPQQEAPVPPPIRPDAHAKTFADNNTDAFGMSRSAGEGHKLRDFLGQPLLIRIHELYFVNDQKNPGQQKEVASVDWIVLDRGNPVLAENARIWNKAVINDLRDTVNSGRRYHLGRPVEVPTKHPQPAIVLHPISDEELEIAKEAITGLGWN